jgi:predicted TIM-barrel fold metal-dependent hydrolase
MDLTEMPVVDGHCHPFTAEYQRLSAEQLRDNMMFMQEGGSPPEALDTLTAHLFIRELAGLLDCAPEFAEVLRARNEAAHHDYAAYVDRVLAHGHVSALMIDTGYPYWKRVRIDEPRGLAPGRQVREVFRIETAFGGPEASIYFDGPRLDFGSYIERYRATCTAAVREQGCVAFKTVMAYHTGLTVQRVSEVEARAAYEASAEGGIAAEKVVRDYLFFVTARVAAELGVPLTVHSGFTGLGKPWSYGDPSGLSLALREPEMRETTFVLLHGGYPWGGAAGFLAAHLPNVYVDMSEVIPSTSIGIERHLEEVLEFAPLSRVMLGSDGLGIPEMHWYGLVMAKRALGNVLGRLTATEVLRPERAEQFAELICHGTAERLYGLPAA